MQYGSPRADLRGLTRSNVSNHLACLRGCGLVVAAYEGRQVRYQLATSGVRDLLDQLFALDLVVDPECP